MRIKVEEHTKNIRIVVDEDYSIIEDTHTGFGICYQVVLNGIVISEWPSLKQAYALVPHV